MIVDLSNGGGSSLHTERKDKQQVQQTTGEDAKLFQRFFSWPFLLSEFGFKSHHLVDCSEMKSLTWLKFPLKGL